MAAATIEEEAISIHAPRTGSDGKTTLLRQLAEISIHAPRTGSDFRFFASLVGHSKFQSTLPARGATRESEQH